MSIIIYRKFAKLLKLIFIIFGLHPIPLDYENKTKDKPFAESIIKLWSIFLMLTRVVIFLVVIYYQDQIFYDRDSVGKINDILKYAMVFLAYIVIIFESMINKNRLKIIYRKLKCFRYECEILHINYAQYNDEMLKEYIRKVFCLAIFYVFIEIKVTTNIGRKMWINFWIVNIIPTSCCRFRHMQHVYFIEIIRSHVLMLKNELQKIVNTSNVICLSTKKESYETSLAKLQAIKRGYGQIWDITNNVNDLLTWSQAANFTHNFVQIGRIDIDKVNILRKLSFHFFIACDMYWYYHILLNSAMEDNIDSTILCSIAPIPIVAFVLFSAERATVEVILLRFQSFLLFKDFLIRLQAFQESYTAFERT